MAITTVNPFGIGNGYNRCTQGTTGGTMNATGEYYGIVGHIRIPAGGSKTLSAAGGGSIVIMTDATSTFLNAGTEIRLGLQDVGADGFPDGTFDVFASMVGGSFVITDDVLLDVPMTSGTKSPTDGDLIAIQCLMVTRAGADSVAVYRVQPPTLNALQRFYGVDNTGAAAKNQTNALLAIIRFDDGTIGWIDGANCVDWATQTTLDASFVYNSGSTPDEYCMAFTPQVPMRISTIGLSEFGIANGDTFEVRFYQTPFGTPSLLDTITPDEDQMGSAASAGLFCARLTSKLTLSAGVEYGIALRPTSANDVGLFYYNLGSGNEDIKALYPLFGSSVRIGSRTDTTGSFSVTQVYHQPVFMVEIDGLDNGASAGGGLKLVGAGGLVG